MHYPVTVVPLDVSGACLLHLDVGSGSHPRDAMPMEGAGLKCHSPELGQGTPLPHEEGLVVTRE